MMAGKATPRDARMMWKPSVNAIWLRAASRVEASGRACASEPVTVRRSCRALAAAPHPIRVVPRSRAGSGPAPARDEVRDDDRDHRDEVDLAGERLRRRERVAEVAPRRQVAVADRRERHEAE